MSTTPARPSRRAPRTPLFGTVLRFFGDILTGVAKLFVKLCARVEGFFADILKQDSKPSGGIVLIFLITFILFGIFLALASKWPIDGLQIGVVAVGCFLAMALLIIAFWEDLRSKPIPVGKDLIK